MSSTIATVWAGLQAKLATVTGITTAPTDIPPLINAADLPMAIVWPGACSWSQASYGLKKQLRTYTIRVYVKEVGLDRPVRAGVDAVLPIMEQLGSDLLDDPTLGGTVDTLQIQENEMTDGGVTILTYPYQDAKIQYWGFEMNVVIKTRY